MILKETIEEVLEHQKMFRDKLLPGIPRDSLTELKVNESFITVISGVRRCGKSTLLRQFLAKRPESSIMLNFEDPRLTGFGMEDFIKFDEISSRKKWEIIAFDEIQHVREWETYVRTKLDEKKQILITGSNASLLSREFGTRLTGRHITKELFPFSYKEFLQITDLEPNEDSLALYMLRGGFPEYLKLNEEEILTHLMDDIIYLDIALRHGIKQHNLLRQLTVYLLSNAAKKYSLNSLTKLFGFRSVRSVSDYVSWLEDSYLLFSLPKFSYSYKKQIANPKKVYCVDTGLASVNSLSFSNDLGRKLENLIFIHLRKTFKTVYYYSEKNECDFIIVQKGQPLAAIQVCHKLEMDNLDRELRGLEEAITDLKVLKAEIITFNQEDSFKLAGKEVKAIPAWKYLVNY